MPRIYRTHQIQQHQHHDSIIIAIFYQRHPMTNCTPNGHTITNARDQHNRVIQRITTWFFIKIIVIKIIRTHTHHISPKTTFRQQKNILFPPLNLLLWQT